MRRTVPFVLLSAAVLGLSAPASSQTSVPAGYDVVARQDLYSGVEYAKVANPSGPVVAHVARIAPGAPVDLRVVNAGDKVPTNSHELETTSSMCARVRCIVGLDGDFHTAGQPVGGVISDGRMMRSPNPARPQLTVTGDGRLTAGPLAWSAAVTSSDGARLPVSTVNATPGTDGLALFTPDYGTNTDPSARIELLVKAGNLGKLNRTTSLELRSIRTGGGPIPADGAILSGDGAAGQQLVALFAQVQSKTLSNRAELRIESPVDADVSIGADPVVLRDGKRALPWNDPNLANYRQPHTLVGWNKAGETFFVAVDGRQTASAGLNMAQAADFLVSLGVTDAVNLDGGGGTVFTAGGTVWNRPSDNDPSNPAQYIERGAVNAFVVMSRPGKPLPAPAPPAPPPLPAGPSGGGPVTIPGSGGDPSTPGAPTAPPSGNLLFGSSPVLGGGQPTTVDLPLGTAAAAKAGGVLAKARPLALDEGTPGTAPPDAGTADGPDHGTPGDAAGEKPALRATLSAASAALGDVVSPLVTRPWGQGNRRDLTLAGGTLLMITALVLRRVRRATFDLDAGL